MRSSYVLAGFFATSVLGEKYLTCPPGDTNSILSLICVNIASQAEVILLQTVLSDSLAEAHLLIPTDGYAIIPG
ncbi:hypothetical protein Vi05172_g2910 [Venturia inaequalis]|nr:hypothetical protein Vi05172_g2910 [Venturia inaequalis]